MLANPEPFIGRCLRPTGPKLLSPNDVADVLGKVFDRKVRYQSVSTKMFVKAARTLGFAHFDIAQVRHYAAEHRADVYADVTTHVEEVCRRPPEDFETTARALISDPDQIYPGLRVGSLPGALWFGVRMMLARAPDLDVWERGRDYPLIRDGALAHENPAWVEAAAKRELVLQPLPEHGPRAGKVVQPVAQQVAQLVT